MTDQLDEHGHPPTLAAGHRTYVAQFGEDQIRIQKNGIGVSDDRLRATLDRYTAGKASEQEVALEYAKARVIAHTGDFSIETADLDELVSVIASFSGAPRIHAGAVSGLPEELLDRLPASVDEGLIHSHHDEPQGRGSRLRSLLRRGR